MAEEQPSSQEYEKINALFAELMSICNGRNGETVFHALLNALAFTLVHEAEGDLERITEISIKFNLYLATCVEHFEHQRLLDQQSTRH